MDDYRGSVFSQARLDGIDYRPILKRAIAFEEAALRSLLAMRFMGEGADTHSTNLLLLMMLWGDERFSKVVAGQPEAIRGIVVGFIDYSWADPDWSLFPKTLANSPDSITERTASKHGGVAPSR